MVKKTARIAQVFYHQQLAGRLIETSDGFEFTYDDDYLAGGTPIAFNYPLQVAPYKHTRLPGFFENLVSEGWLRKLQSQQQKIDENDRFGLLLMNGRDLVGAVTIVSDEKDNA
ncbi:MAG: HipA N-terminal domain-containing protein [Gammaproteobacteria bacterium]|nr:HipA N-terminal domain-containing protein [Gammaproteobacteria bacterium]MBQ0841285.1 HipA N-terminal domain-containing protein [Gammaproteobacteria bacterium]